MLLALGLSLMNDRVNAQELQRSHSERPMREAKAPAELYARDCAVCHGPAGEGTPRGPTITESGPALVHFMLTSGYMPIDDPGQRMRRKDPRYSREEIEALTAYVSTFVHGPEVEEVEPKPDAVIHGGELYRFHCASCHQFAGVGGVLLGSRPAPSLHSASATEVAEALRTGPGTMPAFSEAVLSREDAEAIASYVTLVLQQPRDPGGIAAGHTGPLSEGLLAVFGGLAAMLAGCFWIGGRG